jgi:hypothetical protein
MKKEDIIVELKMMIKTGMNITENLNPDHFEGHHLPYDKLYNQYMNMIKCCQNLMSYIEDDRVKSNSKTEKSGNTDNCQMCNMYYCLNNPDNTNYKCQ